MKIYLGNQNNEEIYEELNTIDNMLISGGPGGGKTVYLSRIIKELTSTFTPEEVKFVIYDDKEVDYVKMKNSPYLLFPLAKNANEFKTQLEELNQISSSRLASKEKKPAIIIIIDGYYAITKCKETILNILKDSKETNIHFFISSQTVSSFRGGLNKAVSTRIAYWLFNDKESTFFIGEKRAENLSMNGDVVVIVDKKRLKLTQKPYRNELYL